MTATKRQGRTTQGMDVQWRIADGIAWVGEADRIALINTTDSRRLPMLVSYPFSSLFRLLAHRSATKHELLSVGREQAGDSDVEGFVDAFLRDFVAARLIVESNE